MEEASSNLLALMLVKAVTVCITDPVSVKKSSTFFVACMC